MIPKKIHFTWFSNDPFPPVVEKCMESWKRILPDYELIHWSSESIKDIDSVFLHEALKKGKWAFAADFVRLYALYNEGGIYLDTDVEVYKSFDPLLDDEAFVGRENSYHLHRRGVIRYFSSHCMGGVRHHPYFKRCLEYYHNRHFIRSEEEWLPDDLKYDQTTLPYIQAMIAAKLFHYDISERVRGVQVLKDGLKVYPAVYFDCEDRARDTYCKHYAMGGWRNEDKNFSPSLKKRLSRRVKLTAYNLAGKFNIVPFRKL